MRFLAVDPGETVGWSLWNDTDLLDGGQTPMWQFIDDTWRAIVEDGESRPIEHLVVEDWQLYPEGVSSGPPPPWDYCRTARAIGALELIARVAGIPITLQPANIKSTAVSAGAEELFVTPRHENRHQNDSIMHAVFFLARRAGAGG